MRRLAVLLALLLLAVPLRAQELNCSVTLDYSTVQGADLEFLERLEQDIQEYLNNEQWTDDRFRLEERIDCNFNISILSAEARTSFEAQVAVTSRRPIYGTVQQTTLFQVNDRDWSFNYTEGQPLIRTPQRYDGVTSVLDFYAYLILGYDYDSFSPLGGTPYLQRASQISQLAQQVAATGWAQVGGSSNSRSDLVQQLLDPRYEPLRRTYYQYHLEGLDRFTLQTDSARATIYATLDHLEEVYNAASREYALNIFFQTKADEIAKVFRRSTYSGDAYRRLVDLDPASSSAYEVLLQ